MNIHTLLSKQWTLPPFLPKRLLLSLLILLAPNAVFWVLALLTATARPIVNLDYLPAALLIALPWRFVKIVGVLAFWLAVLFDGLMMVIQLFPFMDLIGAINLVPFILTAPAPYQIMTGLLLLYMLAMPFVLQKATAKTDFRHIAVCAAVVAAAGYFTGHLSYYDRGRMANIFGANNFYYAKSQAMLYTVSQNADFITAGLVDPVFLPLGNQQRAATHLNEPKSQKILFIVAESWGLPANPELQNATFAKLLAQKDRFSVWESGSFPFIGATVEGEMRELCAYGGLRGFALRRAPDEKFARCLPNRLKQEGYATFAMHGAGSSLYDRFSWYPRAGFQEIKTAENLCHFRRRVRQRAVRRSVGIFQKTRQGTVLLDDADQPRRLSRIRHFQPQAQMHRIRPARRNRPLPQLQPAHPILRPTGGFDPTPRNERHGSHHRRRPSAARR